MARTITEHLERRGVDAARLLAEVGIGQRTLLDARNMLPVRQLDWLIQLAYMRSADPCLGLAIGGESGSALDRLLTCLTLCAPTLRDALELLGRFSALLVDGLETGWAERDGLAMLSIDAPRGFGVPARSFLSEALSLALLRVLRAASAEMGGLERCELRLSHEAPAYARLYADYFACPVRFGAARNTFVFSAGVLDRTRAISAGFMFDAVQAECSELLDALPARSTFAERARRLLRRQRDLCHIDIDAIARDLDTNTRTLRRRLTAEGTALSSLLDEVRTEMAVIELLRNGGSTKEAADSLGYSEVSAFHRAFRRWTGRTPAEFVRAHKPSTHD